MTKLTRKAKGLWDKLNDGTQKVVSTITSFGIIAAACISACQYVVNQFDAHIQQQTTYLKEEIDEIKLSTTRNELMMLIKNYPTNVIEIEKIAKKYFLEMKGDFYMTDMYSTWAKAHGADTAFVLYHN